MSSQPRLRIAPSPTGQLHVGTARTALYNYLYARHIGGHFAMRIEDTDVERSKREHADAFCDMLRWMGIDWDGDIIYQSDRFTLYRKAIDSLLEQNLAYECFETQEELEAINIERKANKLAPGYDGSAKNLTEEQKQVFRDAGRSRTVRFATPSEGISEFIDAIRGTVKVQWSSVSDFIIERSDGTPTFFLANAVDDIDMGITHVIRGDDLIDSTHRVLALRRALGNSEQPFYAHTPMILATDKSKLSKRHGAVSLESYKDLGYLPAAMVNYLALLGWAPGDDREIVSLKEMVDEFDVENVNHSGAIFDIKKLEWMNGEYIRKTNLEELIATVEPSAKFKYGENIDSELLNTGVGLAQTRATTLTQIIDQLEPLLEPIFSLSDETKQSIRDTENAKVILEAIREHLENCEWNLESVDLRGVVNDLGLKPRKALPIVYLAIENSKSGLPLFDVIFKLGRNIVVNRISEALAAL
ncbi:MAG: glutamate--tRNA ligase [Acidimicrobiia bacterium]